MVTRSNRRNTKGRIRFRAKLSLSLHLSLSLSLSLSLFASIHNRTSLAAFSFIRESKERNSLSLSLSFSKTLCTQIAIGRALQTSQPLLFKRLFRGPRDSNSWIPNTSKERYSPENPQGPKLFKSPHTRYYMEIRFVERNTISSFYPLWSFFFPHLSL